jgi:hypothetical protein
MLPLRLAEEDLALRTERVEDAPLLPTLVRVAFAERVAELPPLEEDVAAARDAPFLEDLLAVDFLAPRAVVLRAAPDLEAAFLAGRLLVFFAAVLLLAVLFLAVLFLAVLFLAVLLLAVLLLAVLFLAAPFLAALLLTLAFLAVLFLAAFFAGDFLAADFLEADLREVDLEAAFFVPEDLDAVLEPPRPVDRRLEAALLRPVDLDAVLDLVLPPALLEEVFLEAAFLVDFAIVNGF